MRCPEKSGSRLDGGVEALEVIAGRCKPGLLAVIR